MMSQLAADDKKNKFSFYMKNKYISSLAEFKELFSFSDDELQHLLGMYQFYFHDHPVELDLIKAEDGNFADYIVRFNGQKAKDVSVMQYLSQSNNAELINLSWNLYPCNDWQVAVSYAKIGLITKHWGKVKRVTDGYETIVTALLTNLQSLSNVTVKFKEKVIRIEELEGKFSVSTQGDQKYFGQKVIYACSEVGLSSISLESRPDRKRLLEDMLSKVCVKTSAKIFLTYARPWWEDCGIYQGIVVTDLPINAISVFGEQGKSNSYATLLAGYLYSFTGALVGLDLDTHERFVNKVGEVNEKFIPSKLLVEYVDKQLKAVMGKKDSLSLQHRVQTSSACCHAKVYSHYTLNLTSVSKILEDCEQMLKQQCILFY